MQFKSTEKQTLTVRREMRCGDGCCSWREIEWDSVGENEVVDLDFEFDAFDVADEDEVFDKCNDGLLVPHDFEAKQWFEEKV